MTHNLCKYTLILTCSLLLSCQKQQQVKFPEPQQLSGQPVEAINVFSKGNVYLTVADTFLVVQKREEPFIQIYSTNTHKLLVEFGSKGKGPGEFLGPSLQKQVGHDSENDSPVIYIFDFKRQMLSTVNILKVINGGKVEKQERLPGDKFLNFFYYKDANFYIGSPASKGRFQIYNYQTSRDTLIPYVPKVNFDIPSQSLSVIYRTAAVVNREKRLMAAAPLYLGELDYFDLKGNYLHSSAWAAKDKFKEELSGGIRAFKHIKAQIVDLDSKGGLIYGLNRNNSVIDYNSRSLKANMKIQVFDWDGEAVKQYYLDERRITYFAIDSVHSRIYGYCPDEKNHTVIQYNM